MRIQTKNSVAILLALAALALGLPVAAAGQIEQQAINQVYPLSPDGEFRINNINGQIVICSWPDKTAKVVATKRGASQEQMDMVKIDIQSDPGRLVILTEYPRGEQNVNVSVDYEVYLPATVRVDKASTVNGSLSVDGMAGDLTVSTVNGAVKIQGATGRVKAEAVNGRIEAVMETLGPSSDIDLQTVNGEIRLGVPARLDADIRAESVNGKLDSGGFPLNVRGKFGPKTMEGSVGRGGARIRMETVNGSIKISQR